MLPQAIRSSAPDIGIVLGISLAISLVAQRWTGLDTPDSSFYASLGLFGSEVTDRAFATSYYWTRLGVIAPVHALTGALGFGGGYAAWRLLLIIAIVASAYTVAQRFASRPASAFLAAATSLSSVVLSYLGNPYLTGPVMAGTAILIALAFSDRRAAALGAGATLGWLVMVNPPGVLLAGVIWLTLRIQRRTLSRANLAHLGIAAAATVVTFVAFLGIGRLLFPEMDWLGSYVSENARIDYRNFASAEAIWLRDISLLVPVAVLVIAIAAWTSRRGSAAHQHALAISASSIAFMLAFNPLMGGIPLEAPMYQAMLWPPAMLALVLIGADAMPGNWGRRESAVATIAVAAVAACGFLAPGWPLAIGWIVTTFLAAGAIVGIRHTGIAAIVGIAVLLAGSQLLQNSRPQLGLYYPSPYAWAFQDNPIAERIRTAVNSQEWLLANTSRDDLVLDWVQGDWVGGDRELYVVAGMQLWGENRVTLGPELTPDDIARMDTIRPTVLAMFGQSMEGVLRFWQSIPAERQATAPTCYDYAWPSNPASPFTVTQGHTCLTRLTWS